MTSLASVGVVLACVLGPVGAGDQDDPLDDVAAALRDARAALQQGDGVVAAARAGEGLELALELDPGAEIPEVAAQVLSLGQLVYSVHDMPRTTRAYEYLARYYERSAGPEHDNTLAASTTLAISLKMQGELGRAREIEEHVLEVMERTRDEDDPRLLGSRGNLANTMAMMRDLEGARRVYEDVLATLGRTRPPDDAQLLATRHDLALVLRALGDWKGACRQFEEALAMELERGATAGPRLWNMMNNLAATWSLLGRQRDAQKLLEQVLDESRGVLPDDHTIRLATLGNLAGVHGLLGDLAVAREMHARVLEGLERQLPPDHPDVLRSRANLAVSEFHAGDHPAARARFESVIRVWEKTLRANDPDLLRVRVHLASCLLAADRNDEARGILEEVRALRLEVLPADHPDVVATTFALAVALRGCGEVDEAAELLDELGEQLEDAQVVNAASARRHIAYLEWTRGNSARAREIYEQVEATLSDLLEEGELQLLETRCELARIFADAGDEEALAELLPRIGSSFRAALASVRLLSRREASQRLHELSRPLSTLIELGGRDRTEPATRAWLLRECFALTESVRAAGAEPASVTARRGDPELDALYGRARELRAHLAATAGGGAGDPSLVSELSLELEGIERDILGRLGSRGTAAVDGDAVARALAPGAVAVGFRSYSRDGVPSLVAFVDAPGTGGGRIERVELGPLAAIVRAVDRWRDALGRPIEARGRPILPDEQARSEASAEEASRAERAAGTALRELVVDPILRAAGEASMLHVCLDEALHLVPLEAFPLEEGRLGDAVTIRREVSFARLASPGRATDAPVRTGLLVAGGIDYGTAADAGKRGPGARGVPLEFAPLPGTVDEVHRIEQLWRAAFEEEPRVLDRDRATKASLASFAPTAGYLHLATHGWFAPESERSILDAPAAGPDRFEETVTGFAPLTLCGLALTGANRGRDDLGEATGILTAEELRGFDLSGCELAVLSACETNVGIRRAGQGIQSLQSALHAAGARTAITSLWKVDDAATRRLMELLYTKLWKDGLGKADALWQAKLALREEGHPIRDWAGWVLTGDPD